MNTQFFRSDCAPRRAFTLIELLVVIAIIAVLIGLLLPAVQKVRDAASRSQCQNNLHQIGIALQMYHDNYAKFPPGGVSKSNGLSYTVFILPYLEQDNLYKSGDPNGPYNAAINQPLQALNVKIYMCPVQFEKYTLAIEATTSFTSSYAGNTGPKDPSNTAAYRFQSAAQGGNSLQGVLGMDTTVNIPQITDGTSNTFLVGELSWKGANSYRTWSRGCWASDSNCHSCKNMAYKLKTTKYNGSDNFNDVSFGSNHASVANFLMCDGSARLVSNSADILILRNTASRDGGETKVID